MVRLLRCVSKTFKLLGRALVHLGFYIHELLDYNRARCIVVLIIFTWKISCFILCPVCYKLHSISYFFKRNTFSCLLVSVSCASLKWLFYSFGDFPSSTDKLLDTCMEFCVTLILWFPPISTYRDKLRVSFSLSFLWVTLKKTYLDKTI